LFTVAILHCSTLFDTVATAVRLGRAPWLATQLEGHTSGFSPFSLAHGHGSCRSRCSSPSSPLFFASDSASAPTRMHLCPDHSSGDTVGEGCGCSHCSNLWLGVAIVSNFCMSTIFTANNKPDYFLRAMLWNPVNLCVVSKT
jgi:hypothetical protein